MWFNNVKPYSLTWKEMVSQIQANYLVIVLNVIRTYKETFLDIKNSCWNLKKEKETCTSSKYKARPRFRVCFSYSKITFYHCMQLAYVQNQKYKNAVFLLLWLLN